MEQEFIIDKQYPHVKATVDKPNELYIFRCNHCLQKLELGFNFAKLHDMKEEGNKFVFGHRQCKGKERPLDYTHEFQKTRNGHYKT